MKQKMFRFISLLALSSVLAVPFVQAEGTAKEKPIGKRTFAKYDADKDGKLSDEEKAKLDADRATAKANSKAKRAAKKEAARNETK